MGGAPHYCPGTREFMSASISLSICSRLQVAQQSGAMCTAASQWAACHEGFGMGDVPAQVFLGRQRVVTLVILIEVFHLRPVGRRGPASFVRTVPLGRACEWPLSRSEGMRATLTHAPIGRHALSICSGTMIAPMYSLRAPLAARKSTISSLRIP